ncbi:MAG: hypothetical protein Q7U97_17630 [Rhodocyclaceae bacterium]|nr:hypothetical protein [Rhodocyclaceae bacterium]
MGTANTTNHTGTTERMLAFIRHRGMATRRDLHDEVGVKLGRIDQMLARHIDAGIVIAESLVTEESRAAVTCFRWNGDVPPGTSPKQHRRSRAQVRSCLCCGDDFMSSGAMNRMCGRCRTRNVSPYAP